MNKPTHFRHKDTVFEYLAPQDPAATSWVILCDGLPAVPQRNGLMSDLAAAGWHVVFPRYAGTWESPGEFLASSPASDINGIIEALSAGALVDAQPPADRIALLGSSFGGAVALSLSAHPSVYRTLALSPVTSFRDISASLATLPDYLRDVYPGAYRFRDSDWQRLMRDELIDLGSIGPEAIIKTAIIVGQDDEQIPADKTVDFALQGHAHFFYTWPNRGHIGFSQVTGDLLQAVLACLESPESSCEWLCNQQSDLPDCLTANLDIP